MSAITRTPCECGGSIGTTSRGAPMDIHLGPCPNIRPRPTWQVPVRTAEQQLASFEKLFRGLLADVDQYGLDAWAHSDWPNEDPLLITQMVSIREQLVCLHSRVDRWAHAAHAEHLAQPLISDILDLLQPSVFIAPVTAPVIVPPAAVARALERLRDVTPATSSLGIPQPGDAVAISQDRRRVRLWAAEFQVD